MDIDKVRALTDAELEQALRDAKRDLWQARFELATRQLKDYTVISGSRRTRSAFMLKDVFGRLTVSL